MYYLKLTLLTIIAQLLGGGVLTRIDIRILIDNMKKMKKSQQNDWNVPNYLQILQKQK